MDDLLSLTEYHIYQIKALFLILDWEIRKKQFISADITHCKNKSVRITRKLQKMRNLYS